MDRAPVGRRYLDGRRISPWLLTCLSLLAPAFAQAQTPVYYSVGTSFPTDLKYGTPSLTIAAGVATFTSPQLGNVGVGDQISYGGASIVYITGRTSATVYSVGTATGGVPANVGVPTAVNSITRAFGLLSTAEANSTNAAHLNTASLTGGNFQLHWAMYNDGPMDDSVIIDGYTTGVNNYIRIFTPVAPSQVGTRQRHTGRAGTGFRLVDINAAPPDPYELIRIMDDHVRIEGIEIDGSRVSGVVDFAGMRTDASVTAAADIRIDKVIIHDIINAVGPGPEDIAGINFGGDGSVRLSNSILYRMHNRTNDLAGSDTHGIRIGSGSSATLFFHNNTIFDVENVVLDGTSLDGISHGGTGTLTVRNTAVLDITDPAGPGICFTGAFSGSSSNNVSSDATAPGPGSLHNQTANASYFVSVTVGGEDLHLRNDSLAIWGGNGADLSADPNLPIVDDVDGQARAALPDIGADEFGTPPLPRMEVKAGKYVGTGVAGKAVYVGFQPDVVFVKRVEPPAVPNNDQNAVLRTSSMAGDNTKWLDNAGIAITSNLIQSLDPTGFTVGSDVAVNEGAGANCAAGCDYHWVAFKAAPGYMSVGTYTGNGAALQSIGVGFEPDYVIVMPPGAGDPAGMPVWTTSTFPMNDSFDFDATYRSPGAITGLESSGFQVGQGNVAVPYRAPDLNVNATTYHYVAWNAVPGSTAVGTYIGNGLDNQYKNQVGFFPEWVLVKKDDIDIPMAGERAVTHKPASTGTSTETLGGLRFAEVPPVLNTIQKLLPLGFEVGSDDRVNSSTATTCRGGPPCTYHWVAFGPHAPQINYRSIGTAPDIVNQGTITVTADSTTVTKTGGTGWAAANRGRGDRLSVGGQDYVIERVVSDDSLILASPAVASFSGGAYTIARQFTTLQAWENCISFGRDDLTDLGPSCPFFPVASASLVDDDRNEVGIAYDDSVFTAGVRFNGTNVNNNTDATHTITLTADHGNRHFGIPGAGVQINNGANPNSAIEIADDYVTVEWMEIFGGGAIPWGIEVDGTSISPGFASTGASRIVLRNNLIHVPQFGISLDDPDVVADVYNNIIYSGSFGIRVSPGALQTWTQIRIVNNTIYNFTGSGINSSVGAAGRPQQITLINNLAADVAAGGPQPGFQANSFAINGASRNNMAHDATAISASPGGGGLTRTLAQIAFVNEAAFNLHIQGTSSAVDFGADLSSILTSDIDNGLRQTAWDIGADDTMATTAVTLQSFTATGGDGLVDLAWQTASELRNMGFHVYRADSHGGPYTRITSSLIPGLGSSPTGQSYRYRDAGLLNGRTYFYKLEDVETTGKTERHGPVSATPMAGSGAGIDAPAPSPQPSSNAPGTAYGKPEAWSLTVRERTDRHVLLELRTGGFMAYPEADGTVRIEVPGFEESLLTGLPVKRGVVEAIAGRKVRLASVVASEETSYPGLLPASARQPELVVGSAGEVRISRKRSRRRAAPRVSPARLEGTMFQGEVKKAEVLFFPLRVESGRLVRSGRILVRLDFSGAEAQESGLGGARGRSARKRAVQGTGIIAQLAVGEAGLYRVTFEDLFGSSSGNGRRPRARGISATSLRLSRQGETVAYHLEPRSGTFGPGSALYFLSAGSALNPYGDAVYELEEGTGAVQMSVVDTAVSGDGLTEAMAEARFEENTYYQAGLLDAQDLWLWDVVMSSSPARSYPFALTQVSASSAPAELVVDLQGASDFEDVTDHHLRFFLNGVPVGETSFDGKVPQRASVPVASGILHDGENELRIENLGDAGAAYSMVFLNRFSLRYARRLVAESGRFEGQFLSGGRAKVTGLPASAPVVDSTDVAPRWIRVAPATGGVAFRAEAGRKYLASSAARSPRVIPVLPSSLKSTDNQADYLVIGPQAFLEVAEPLLEQRRSQGLVSRAVSTEEVFQEFGHGENTPEAIREFLEHAYQQWKRPSLRYVLLLGDASYDPKDILKTGARNWIPVLTLRTSYLWTASDPAYAAVNGSDLVPDLAIGRLSASSVEEARLLVEKVLAFEGSGRTLGGAAALVADNPDLAGDFERDANEIASTILASRNPERIFLREQGAQTRPAIHAALDRGLSLLSYVGHGGTAVWASENVFNYEDVGSLALQSQQPLLLTMNCLNGFFHFPPMNSLSEALVKADGKGAIAAFSPTGLSLNDSAHVYHKALLAEIVSGRHERLGDAVLAAQQVYADSGAFPELLSIYHLLGDPALKIQ